MKLGVQVLGHFLAIYDKFNTITAVAVSSINFVCSATSLEGSMINNVFKLLPHRGLIDFTLLSKI